MIVNNIQYICDHCKEEVSEEEYRLGATITISVDLKNPTKDNGGRLETSSMQICTYCANELGIIDKDDYRGFFYGEGLIKDALEKTKEKLFKLFYKK